MPGITKHDSALHITQGLSVVVAVVAADEVDMVNQANECEQAKEQEVAVIAKGNKRGST